MISLSHLNKLIIFVIFFKVLTFNFSFAEDKPVDIWKKQENQNEQSDTSNSEKTITTGSSSLSEDTLNSST